MTLQLLIEVTIKSTLFWDVMFTDVLEDHAVYIFSAEEFIPLFPHSAYCACFLGVLLDAEDAN
jgi:hypothetical protein